ncbi:MAG TPA: hypothetical protein PLN52_21785 [Opitutaceae bacterium]|nr:hypothetical protein [Opitutaceae bacterium]
MNSPSASSSSSQANTLSHSGNEVYRVDVDWRNQSAYYVESRRKVWLMLSKRIRGHAGVDHMYAIWEYQDGRREELSASERTAVLRRTIDFVRDHEGVTLIPADPLILAA